MFHKLNSHFGDERNKYISQKVDFGMIPIEYVRQSFDFAYDMI